MLNDVERAQAAANGWVVCHVYDLKSGRTTVQVLPAANSEVKSADALLKVVIARAQNNDAFAQRVLKLVMAGVQEPTKTKRKKK
jgi:hypothetical protein